MNLLAGVVVPGAALHIASVVKEGGHVVFNVAFVSRGVLGSLGIAFVGGVGLVDRREVFDCEHRSGFAVLGDFGDNDFGEVHRGVGGTVGVAVVGRNSGDDEVLQFLTVGGKQFIGGLAAPVGIVVEIAVAANPHLVLRHNLEREHILAVAGRLEAHVLVAYLGLVLLEGVAEHVVVAFAGVELGVELNADEVARAAVYSDNIRHLAHFHQATEVAVLVIISIVVGGVGVEALIAGVVGANEVHKLVGQTEICGLDLLGAHQGGDIFSHGRHGAHGQPEGFGIVTADGVANLGETYTQRHILHALRIFNSEAVEHDGCLVLNGQGYLDRREAQQLVGVLGLFINRHRGGIDLDGFRLVALLVGLDAVLGEDVVRLAQVQFALVAILGNKVADFLGVLAGKLNVVGFGSGIQLAENGQSFLKAEGHEVLVLAVEPVVVGVHHFGCIFILHILALGRLGSHGELNHGALVLAAHNVVAVGHSHTIHLDDGSPLEPELGVDCAGIVHLEKVQRVNFIICSGGSGGLSVDAEFDFLAYINGLAIDSEEEVHALLAEIVDFLHCHGSGSFLNLIIGEVGIIDIKGHEAILIGTGAAVYDRDN